MLKQFHKPATIEEALKLKQELQDAMYIAGGTEINSRKDLSPQHLIDLSLLKFNKIEEKDRGVFIGALVSFQEILESTLLAECFSPLITAVSRIGNRNIRNQATIGGNITTDKSCSDILALLFVYRTSLEIYRNDSTPVLIPLEAYRIEQPKPLIGRVKISIPSDETYIASSRFSRTVNDLGIIQVAVSFRQKQSRYKSVGLALGGVASEIMRIPKAERFLEDKVFSLSPINEFLDVIQQAINPIDDHRGSAQYKRHIVNTLVNEIFTKFFEEKGAR